VIRMFRLLFAGALVAAPIMGCASYPDLRPGLAPLDRAFARFERRFSTPSPAKTPQEQAEIDAADLALARQARKTIAAMQGGGK